MATGTKVQGAVSNLEYDWLTVMHNKAEAIQAYDKYMQDARDANSQECIDLLTQLKQTDMEQVQEIRKNLMKTMSQS